MVSPAADAPVASVVMDDLLAEVLEQVAVDHRDADLVVKDQMVSRSPTSHLDTDLPGIQIITQYHPSV